MIQLCFSYNKFDQINNQKKYQSKNGKLLNIQNYFYNYYAYSMPVPFFVIDQLIPSQQTQQLIQQNVITNNLLFAPTFLPKIEENSQYVLENQSIQKIELTAFDKTKKVIGHTNRKTQTDSFTQKRNIVPNNINHILAFVQRKSKSEHLVRKVINRQKGKTNYSVKGFYCYQAQLKEKLYIHVNKGTLETLISHLNLHSDIFSVEEQLFYNRVCRIIVSYYLREKAKLTILTSFRVRQTNKLDHLRAQRSLLKFIAGIDDLQ